MGYVEGEESKPLATTFYTLGFIFNADNGLVLLQYKHKPLWQRGKLNGIGGKVEDETPMEAMERESIEEVGRSFDWRSKLSMLIGADKHISVFKSNASINEMKRAEKFSTENTPEPCEVFSVEEIIKKPILHNLLWIVPLLADDNLINGVVNQRERTT